MHHPQGKAPPLREALKSIYFELFTGSLLGLACGTIIGAVALVWLGNIRVAICLMGGIFGGVLISALMGLIVPTVLRHFGKEPQIAAGPIALAGSDIISLCFYLSLAHWLM